MIVVVDCGTGNLGSIRNMLRKVGAASEVSRDPEVIARATKLILPGVGAFDSGMSNLRRFGLVELLNRRVLVDRVPVLGICLGMQLMTNGSEEGVESGLGWIAGRAVRLRRPGDPHFKVPHMGWNVVYPAKQHAVVTAMSEEPRFYFVHSYHVCCADPSDVLLTAQYGSDFVAAFQRANVIGVQFHPEKSHRFGMQLFRTFAEGS